MCGITGGVWTERGRPLEQRVLERMTDALAHRGPDDRGFHRQDVSLEVVETQRAGAALGHRRLSIIDRAGGAQPMANEDESVWIVFNGEIYNYRTLRHRLEGSGHRLCTHSDTETILHLYEDLGPGCLEHLEGMFAFAIWDARRGRLFMARDRLGEKPLYYTAGPDRLLFGSALKSLLAVEDVPRGIDPQAIDEYLTYQYVPHPRTIFAGISKLPPAHYALWHRGQLDVRRYWQPPREQTDFRPYRQQVDELRGLMTDAVHSRLESEVPLGAFLSGGVDSSIVVGLMSQAITQPVQTFSIGFPVRQFDETEHAWTVARRLGTEHRQFRVDPNAVEVLPKLIWHYDEPFADSSAIPTYYVSQFARQHVTVALTGDGGDELFAGYPRYRAVRLGAMFDRLPGPLRALAGDFWRHLPASARQKSWRRRFKKLVLALRQHPGRRYLNWIAIFDEQRRGELYSDEFLARLPDSDPFAFLAAVLAETRGRDPVTAASLTDLETYLPCDLMTKVDVASMAHGLECRQPFLDHRLVEFAAGLPVQAKMPLLRGKRILRRAFHDMLPRSIRRRGKMGFGVPLDHWFRNELRELVSDTLLDARARDRGYFQPDQVERLVREHQTGAFDHSYRLWALLVLELWHREWVDRV
ncbi:MAG: asparagine synthase (glutamine-hydrolyzing) [Planctomycetales bacterium]|nr:asparagine synthase (glutamine-hydrolyzing) [Planctomycetales bacterium]